MTTTDTNVQNLIINTMTKAIYDDITPSNTELYLITDESPITSSDVVTALGYTPENSTNKVTSISSSSTNTQYPSAKAVWDNTLHSVSYDATTQTLTIA